MYADVLKPNDVTARIKGNALPRRHERFLLARLRLAKSKS